MIAPSQSFFECVTYRLMFWLKYAGIVLPENYIIDLLPPHYQRPIQNKFFPMEV